MYLEHHFAVQSTHSTPLFCTRVLLVKDLIEEDIFLIFFNHQLHDCLTANDCKSRNDLPCLCLGVPFGWLFVIERL